MTASLLLGLAFAVGIYAVLTEIDRLREDAIFPVNEDNRVPRALHESRVRELLEANNREQERRRAVAAAARDLRAALRALRPGEAFDSERGRNVTRAAQHLDDVLERGGR